jgi:hypothetical protein
MTTLAVHTPLDRSPAQKIGRALYRKRILPVGEITYDGKPLKFTREMHEQIAAAFNAGAYDSVPFQLTNDKNEHTDDPERTRGVIKGFELTSDGLDALIEVGDRGRAAIEENPNLAVSARIKLDLTRADGKHFPAAIAHVLGTPDPRVAGLGPWEKVADLAADLTPVVDLTAESFAPEGTGMALTPEQEAKLAKLLDNVGDDGTISAGASHDPLADLSEEELQAIIDAATDPAPQAGDLEPAPATASLTADQQQAIDLANATADQAQQRVQAMEAQLAATQWAADRAAYLQAGVPKVMLDLAEPVAKLPGNFVIDLSNSGGEKVNATDVVRGLLDAAKGTVDLSGPKGDPTSESNPDEAEARESVVKAYLERHSLTNGAR